MSGYFCAKCGSTIELVRGGSGSMLCAYCRGSKSSETLHRYYVSAWRKQVAKDEAQLDHDISEAARYGLSYGNYIALRKCGKLPPLVEVDV